MSAIEDYRKYIADNNWTYPWRCELADKVIGEKEAEIKAVIAIAKHNLPPELIHSFLDDLRDTLGRPFVELYNS